MQAHGRQRRVCECNVSHEANSAGHSSEWRTPMICECKVTHFFLNRQQPHEKKEKIRNKENFGIPFNFTILQFFNPSIFFLFLHSQENSFLGAVTGCGGLSVQNGGVMRQRGLKTLFLIHNAFF